MSDDRDQPVPGADRVQSGGAELPRRIPVRTGSHRAPEPDEVPEAHLTAILRHLTTEH
ncbi:MAG TPA: hypothetical protein VGN37_31465 [Actinocatenispora sp.]